MDADAVATCALRMTGCERASLEAKICCRSIVSKHFGIAFGNFLGTHPM